MQKPAVGYDVFLSYTRADAAAAEALRGRLAEAGLRAFLDRYALPAGQPWQPWLEHHLASCRALAVLLGPSRLGDWQLREIQLGLGRQTKSRAAGFPVIPVLLPGLQDADIPLGTFLNLNTRVDLRHGLDDPEALERLIKGVQGQAIGSIALDLRGLSPYRGLLPFREQDAGLFFGRERFVDELASKVRQRTSTNTVAVVGRSGSGKSSIVSAGLFPTLRKEKGVGEQAIWDIVSLRPLSKPLLQLARIFASHPGDTSRIADLVALKADVESFRKREVNLAELVHDRLQADRGSTRLLLYVDQWEELYTQAQPREIKSEEDRQKAADARLFVDLLLEAAATSPCTLVLSVRSDFYPDIQNHDALRAAVQDSQVSLGPMREVELRAVIEGPATALGSRVQPELTERLIRDIGLDVSAGERDQYDIGKLPLLEYALEQAWTRRTGQEIGLGQYAGLEQALEQRANELYERLPPEQQAAAKRLFVSLVTPGEGREDTRSRLTLSPDPATSGVIDTFAGTDARLIVTGDSAGNPSVEVTHEALIRHWEKLRAWIDENRENLRTRAALVAARAEWLKYNKRSDLLIEPGLRLEAARKLRDDPGDVVIDDIKDYIGASIEQDEKEQWEREEQQRREIALAHEQAETAQRLAEERARNEEIAYRLAGEEAARARAAEQIANEQKGRIKITRRATAFIALLATLMTGIAWWALEQQKAADIAGQLAQEQRDAAVANETRALSALSRVATSDHRPVDAVKLGLAAWPRGIQDDRPWLETALTSISDALSSGRLPVRRIMGHESPVSGALWSENESRILSWSWDNTLRLWDAATGQPIGSPMRHDDPIWGARWSRDGSRILSWSRDKTLRLWDPASGQPIGSPMRHEDSVRGALWSRDESRILSWSGDNTLRLWDATTGQPLGPPMRHDGAVRGAQWSRDGSRILSWSEDRTLRLWDAATGQPLGPAMRHDGPVYGAQWSRDGSRILSWSGDKTLRLWDAATGQPLGPPMRHDSSVWGAQWSRDESRILSWSENGTLRLWDVATGQPLGSPMRHNGPVSDVLWSRDESRILSWSGDNTLRLWDAASGQPLGPAMRHDGAVRGAQWSRDGSRILSWSYDNTLRLWDVTTGQPIGSPMRHEDSVSGALWSRDESRILSWSGDNTLRLWDAASGQPLGPAMRHGNDVYGAQWSRDESRILSWSEDRTLRLWDAASGQPLGPAMRHGNDVEGAQWSRDESRILSWSGDNTLRLWDAASGQPLGPAMRHESSVNGAQWSRDESRILSWSEDRTLRLWDAASGQPLGPAMRHGNDVEGAQWSRDGSRILSWSKDNTLRLWDAATGQPIGSPMRHDGPVYGAQWSRDESRILSWSEDGTLRVWDVATGQPLGPAMRHDGAVRGAQWSRDESRILSWSYDNTLRLWDVTTGQPIGSPMRHEDSVSGALWSRDESRILSWCGYVILRPNTLRLWDATTGQPLGPAMRHESSVNGALWSRDESRILSWSGDNTLRLWDVATGQPLGPPMRHDGAVRGAQWSRDGSRILSWSEDRTLRLWDAASGQPLGPAMRHESSVNGALWSRDESRILSWSGDNTLRLWNAKWPDGTILEVACALLSSDRSFNLGDVSQRYGISITEPICTPEQLRVPLDWSKIERAPPKPLAP